jgi:uncharacterized protein YwqG
MAGMADPDLPLALLARRHLPSAVADRWAALMRPGLHLRPAQSSEPSVGRLGGLPELPNDLAWPCWEDRPLDFVAAIDCGKLPSYLLDIALPGSGSLLFFHRHPRWDDFDLVVETSAPETQAGAQVVYVPAGLATAERPVPAGAEPFGRVRLTADVVATGPDWEHPALAAAVRELSDEDRAFMADPMNSDPFRMAMGEHATGPQHRIGGYADPVQGSVEVDVARVRLGGRVSYDDPALHEEAQRWILLAQIDTDKRAGMTWGDCGALYWLIRPDDLAARRFEATCFTWQCY